MDAKVVPVRREHMTIHVPFEMQDKIRAHSYWERRSIRDVVNDAFEQYFAGKQVKPLPTSASDWSKTKKRKSSK